MESKSENLIPNKKVEIISNLKKNSIVKSPIKTHIVKKSVPSPNTSPKKINRSELNVKKTTNLSKSPTNRKNLPPKPISKSNSSTPSISHKRTLSQSTLSKPLAKDIKTSTPTGINHKKIVQKSGSTSPGHRRVLSQGSATELKIGSTSPGHRRVLSQSSALPTIEEKHSHTDHKKDISNIYADSPYGFHSCAYDEHFLSLIKDKNIKKKRSNSLQIQSKASKTNKTYKINKSNNLGNKSPSLLKTVLRKSQTNKTIDVTHPTIEVTVQQPNETHEQQELEKEQVKEVEVNNEINEKIETIAKQPTTETKSYTTPLLEADEIVENKQVVITIKPDIEENLYQKTQINLPPNPSDQMINHQEEKEEEKEEVSGCKKFLNTMFCGCSIM